MELRLNNELILTLPTVEQFIQTPASFDAGYGKDLFTIMNTLHGFTHYDSQLGVSHYLSKHLHSYARAALYQPSVKDLNTHLLEIISGIERANPDRVMRKYSWLEKLLLKDKEEKAIYISGVKDINCRYIVIQNAMNNLKTALQALREVRRNMLDVQPFLDHIVQEGYAFVEQHENNANSPYAEKLDRFNRQLLNAVAFQNMAQMNIQQVQNYIELSQATLDRTLEISTVLVPLWRSLYSRQILENGELNMEPFAELGDLYNQVIQKLRTL
jgi:hypothetical protein